MATLKEPFALDRSLNTTEVTPRNIADVLAEGLSHITGRTASEVEYDNTDSGLTSDDVQGAIDELSERPTLPSVDIQTAVDEFETYNGGLLSECKVALSPNQDLHGYDSPWVGGAGKNKADINDLSLVQNDSGNKLLISNLALTAGTYTMSFDVSKTITSTRNRPLYVISGQNTYAPTDYNTQGRGSWTFTLSADSTVTFYWWVADNSLAVDITNFMIESGSTATTFAPYSNICPISGHTQVEVDVSDGQTTQEQVTVNLGGTYYSGTLDVVSGVFTPDTASVDLGTLTWTYEALWGVGSDFYAVISGIKPTSSYDEITTAITEQYKAVSRNTMYNNTGSSMAVMTNGAVKIRDNRYSDEASFTSAVSGVKLVYPLATPTPIQLIPTPVKANVGENHLSTPLEGQEITESKYRELFTWNEVESYVNAHSGGGSGMNYSTNEQVVGTWIDGKPLYQKTVDQTIGSDGDYTVFANGISHAHLVNSCFEYSSGRWMSFDYISLGATSNNRTCYVDVQNGALNLHNQSSSSIHWIATIQYTKTSD